MGRHSSDSDTSYSSRSHVKKRKKHRSRSRSRSSTDSYSRRRSKKSKKSKQRKRSKSRSSERSYHSSRRRSRSRGKGRSRSYSRSPYSRRRRSRSGSRSRQSSRSRHSSRSRRNSRSRRSRSHSNSPSSGRARIKVEQSKLDSAASLVPGFSSMTPAQQAEVKLQLALKAAADQKQTEGGQTVSVTASVKQELTVEEQHKRSRDIAELESEDFTPASFKSGRSSQPSSSAVNSHTEAIFGLQTMSAQPLPSNVNVDLSKFDDPKLLFGPLFNVSQEEKMKRWIEKLTLMRKRVLEGEAM